jgi:hypothetical protein
MSKRKKKKKKLHNFNYGQDFEVLAYAFDYDLHQTLFEIKKISTIL